MKHIFSLLFIVMLAGSLQAKIWRVNNTPEVDADFNTAQEAHDGASNGDTLYFEGSPDSYGDLTSIKKLVILGPGYFLGENKGHQANLCSAKLSTIYLKKEAGRTASPGSDAIEASSSAGTVICGTEVSGGLYIYTPSNTIQRCKLNSAYLKTGSSTTSPISGEFYPINSNNTVIIQNYIYWLSIDHADNIVFSNNICSGGINNDSYSNNITCSNNTFYYNAECINLYNATIHNNILLDPEGYASVRNSTHSNNNGA